MLTMSVLTSRLLPGHIFLGRVPYGSGIFALIRLLENGEF